MHCSMRQQGCLSQFANTLLGYIYNIPWLRPLDHYTSMRLTPKTTSTTTNSQRDLPQKKAFYVWSNLDTGSVEIISKWIHMNGPAYHVHVVATRVLGICLLFFNEMLFKLRIQINFFLYQKWRIFFQSFHDLLFAFCNRKNLHLRNAPTYANYDIPKFNLFRHLFFF